MFVVSRILVVVGSVVALVTGAPTGASAQAARAGVVTTLEGTALVERAALPQPSILRLKQDVHVQDRISTRESSLVRILLGGRALVTVREYSVLTITQAPAGTTLRVDSGGVGWSSLATRRHRSTRSGSGPPTRSPPCAERSWSPRSAPTAPLAGRGRSSAASRC